MGRVTARLGNVMYEVQPDRFPQQTVRRHADQLTERTVSPFAQQTSVTPDRHHHPPAETPRAEPCIQTDQERIASDRPPIIPHSPMRATSSPQSVVPLPTPEQFGDNDVTDNDGPEHTAEQAPRRSTRATKGVPPLRFDL